MQTRATDASLTERLVDVLHVEAMVLADEVRTYFDDTGRAERDQLAPLERVTFSCESLKVTTRLMHVIGWLLTRRAIAAGELPAAHADMPSRRLARVEDGDPATIAALPESARALIAASRELHARVARLEKEIDESATPAVNPALSLLSRLERAF